ncbi:MAG: HEAT repeat domain-containing protein [Planctomycetota bacterium]
MAKKSSPVATLLLGLVVSGCGQLGPLRRGDPEVSVATIQRAAECNDPLLLQPLLEILERRAEGDDDETLYYQALASALVVGDRGDRPAVPVLLRLVEDPKPALRLNVVEALALIGGPDAESALREVATADLNARVRALAAALLEAGLLSSEKPGN